jgi:steroid delta-isomerase-like uncharacterized protein
MTSGAGAEELVRRYIERVWNRGDIASLEELTTPGFLYNFAGQPPRDRAAFSLFILQTRQAFPDWRVEPDRVISDSTAVAVRWHGSATHRGPFQGIPPTGRAINVSGINLYVIEGGKIAAEWEQTDSLGMLRQLGVLPG